MVEIEWACHACTLLNPRSTQICVACNSPKQKPTHEPQPGPSYQDLAILSNENLVENREEFRCILCKKDIPAGGGVILKQCIHHLCKFCLSNAVESAEESEIRCPYKIDGYSCDSPLLDEEVKALMRPQVHGNYLEKNVDQFESQSEDLFHCQTTGCDGWCITEGEVREFNCLLCGKMNCLICQVIHTGLNCQQYQDKVNQATGELVEETEWKCPACTFLNPEVNQACAMCGTLQQNGVNRSLRPGASIVDPLIVELAYLEDLDLVESRNSFECAICLEQIAPGDGVILKECLHQFCKTCLGHTVEYTEEIEVKCPHRDDHLYCNKPLQEREIKALVSENIYERYLEKSLARAENQIDNTVHCKTPDCRGWCIVEDDVREFACPVCKKANCLACQAIHQNMNCKQYQDKLKTDSASSSEAQKSIHKINQMITSGDAMKCPRCGVVIMKTSGCDGMLCRMCNLDICWVTKGPRWGPKGRGDTSGGCRCMMNGTRCHPECQNCH